MKCTNINCIWNKFELCKCEYSLIIKFNKDKTKVLKCSAYTIITSL